MNYFLFNFIGGQKQTFFICILSLLCALPYISGQYGSYNDIAGDFCAKRGREGNNYCCDGRIDSCSLPILGTLCYCDQFCNRTTNPDCCPDYWEVCLGIPTTPRPDLFKVCYANGLTIPPGGSINLNCNKCKCKEGELTCEDDLCLVDGALLNSLQDSSRRLGWTAANYTQFWGKKLNEGFRMLTGTLLPGQMPLRMKPITLFYDESELPSHFDARTKWDYLGGVRDQGWCGASWAFSTVSVAQDRLAIASKGMEVVELSPQSLLSCNRRGQQACNGGYLERAWGYFRKVGVAPEECNKYRSGFEGSAGNCKLECDSTLQDVCQKQDFPMGRTALYSAEPAFRIASKDSDIMYELMTNGPVQALMRVYQDFFLYKDGVYSRSSSTGKFSLHSVKLIGWGEQRSQYGPSIKYWLATNSWGQYWGEQGSFKIRRGTNESNIEQFILAVRPHLSEEARVINLRRKRYGCRHRQHRRHLRHRFN